MIYKIKTACIGDDYFLGAHLYAQSYMIVGWCEDYAAANGFYIGTLLEDVPDSEVELTELSYSDFDFCDTWAFQQCINMQPQNLLQSAQAAIATARQQMQREMSEARAEMMAEAERIVAEPEVFDDIHVLPDSFISTMQKTLHILKTMRRAQKAKQYNVKNFESAGDEAISLLDNLFNPKVPNGGKV